MVVCPQDNKKKVKFSDGVPKRMAFSFKIKLVGKRISRLSAYKPAEL